MKAIFPLFLATTILVVMISAVMMSPVAYANKMDGKPGGNRNMATYDQSKHGKPATKKNH
jgi:hypothetical protein